MTLDTHRDGEFLSSRGYRQFTAHPMSRAGVTGEGKESWPILPTCALQALPLQRKQQVLFTISTMGRSMSALSTTSGAPRTGLPFAPQIPAIPMTMLWLKT